MNKSAIILAAGKGVRMRSDLPKVSHALSGKPMIAWVLESVSRLGLDRIFVIVGYKADLVRQECEGFDVTFVEQKEQLGTGHAVMQARPFIDSPMTVVLNGDVPLIRTATLKGMMDFHVSKGASATVMTAFVPDPNSYGRIIRGKDGQILKIVEQKDATAEEKNVKEVNSGTYCFVTEDLFSSLDAVKPDNAQKEYYLTDVISILKNRQKPVYAYRVEGHTEVLGVNTLEDLARLEGIYKNDPRVQ